ncbi:MAG: tRNA-guanine transglycosylase [Rhizomicrobium sp.]
MRAMPTIRSRWTPPAAAPACRQFSRAYLHHTVKANEIIASMLLTWHNLTFYQDLMEGLRGAVAAQRVGDFAAQFLARYRAEPRPTAGDGGS